MQIERDWQLPRPPTLQQPACTGPEHQEQRTHTQGQKGAVSTVETSLGSFRLVCFLLFSFIQQVVYLLVLCAENGNRGQEVVCSQDALFVSPSSEGPCHGWWHNQCDYLCLCNATTFCSVRIDASCHMLGLTIVSALYMCNGMIPELY